MSEAPATPSASTGPVAASTPKPALSQASRATKGKGRAKTEVKAETKSEEGKEGKWSTDDTAKLLFIMMQQDNNELLATGWKAIFEKVHEVFGDKYTDAAVKKYWQRLRKSYLDKFPISEKGEDAGASGAKAGAAKSKAVPKAGTAKSRKRPAHAVEDGGEEGASPKKAKTEKENGGDGDSDGDSDGDKEGAGDEKATTAKPKAKAKGKTSTKKVDVVEKEEPKLEVTAGAEAETAKTAEVAETPEIPEEKTKPKPRRAPVKNRTKLDATEEADAPAQKETGNAVAKQEETPEA